MQTVAQNLRFPREIYSDGSGKATAFEGAEEDACEHRSIQPPGVGVAQRRMVAAEEGDVVGQKVLSCVAEGVGGAAFDDTFVEQMREVAVPGDLAEADDYADLRKRGNFGGEVRRAVADFLGCGLVAGRGAADDRANPDLPQLEAVVAADSGGFAGQAELVQDGIHEVAGAVACKWPPRTVGTVGTGREAKDEDACIGITEAGHGLRPVFLIAVGFATRLADASNVGDQSRATGAVCDGLLELAENGEGVDWDRPLGAHVESS